ncbi:MULTISPECIES: hypothetical protein [Aureimonas]|uniref:Uncharacterized protein n=1 Tax=Aureimonas pseudogalii TaxID=1744844 RepID=A0A7W6H717_9HYPH|nr:MULTISPECIES: hypothetical protein [Aureimonas]MBB3999707.1 hypothetical protein [Aureimonas pseudogalii]
MIETTTQTPRRCGALPIGDRAMTDAERSRRYRRRHSTTRLLRLPADPADWLTALADRLGVDPGSVLTEALEARAYVIDHAPWVLEDAQAVREIVERGGA